MNLLSRFALTASLLTTFLFVSAVGTGAEVGIGEGWHHTSHAPLPKLSALGTYSRFPSAASASSKDLAEANNFVASGPSPTASTVELQALAAGLQNDPVQIFNFVKNKIEFQPYYGCNKGAHTTYLDGAGNDYDQACLLVALLNQAGFTATQFVFGELTVPDKSANGANLGSWLGMSPELATFVFYNSGTPFIGGINYGTHIEWTFEHVWVRVTIAGVTYDLDPSFKQNEIIPGIDYKLASGYSRSQLLVDGAGVATADYAQNVNRTAIETRLAQYTTTLNTYIKSNLPNAHSEEVFGGVRLIEADVSSLAGGAPRADFTPTVNSTAASLPASAFAAIRVQIDSDVDVTVYAHSLQGRRLSLVFAGSNAQVWLGDEGTPVAQQVTGAGTTASVALSISHPDASLNQSLGSRAYSRTGSYDFTYSFFPNQKSNGLIEASDRQLQRYLASGFADNSRQVLTETLHGLGLKWVRRVALETDLVGRTQQVYGATNHILGRSGQELGYYVDMPGVLTTMFDTAGTNIRAFNASAFLSSAMEHGVIEQTTASAALSTVKCLALANENGQRVYRATSANFNTAVSPQLLNYSAAQKTSFGSLVGSGFTVLIHQNGATGLNQWSGFGYAAISNVAQMIIAGGYSGGYSATKGSILGSFVDWLKQLLSGQGKEPANTTQPISPEPVNLATGAYTLESTDLTLGEQGSPRGLRFSRYYDSSRSFTSGALGNGWRHSCEGFVTLSSELNNAFCLLQPYDASQTVLGVLAVCDFADVAYSPKEMVVGVLATHWTVQRMLYNAANVQLGNERLTFISQPDGSWRPPPGTTTNLTGSNGAFTLLPRFGGSVAFDTSNRISQWKDVDNNTQTFAYDTTSGRLSSVTDSFGRTLTFSYYSSGAGVGKIMSVTDSTARSVQFAYTAGTYSGPNLTSVTDPESSTSTQSYDARNRITGWLDANGAKIAENSYDFFDRVVTQKSQGIAAHTWQFLYSPGKTHQIDPSNGKTTHLFDRLSRHVGTVNALGKKSSANYDGQNHIVSSTDATARKSTFAFDGNQNLSQATDSDNKSTGYQYDAFLRLWKVTDATNKTTTYGYDAEHHLTSVIDPGARETKFFYRANGLLDHIVDAATHSTTFNAYDAFGNVTSLTRADGTTTAASYNARGDRLTYTDGRGFSTSFTYDKRRALKTLTDANLKVSSWTYDANGYPDSFTDRDGNTTTYTYNNLGKIEGLEIPDTGAVSYSYDNRDWLETITDGLSHSTTVGYDSAGRKTSITNPLLIVSAQWVYDDAGRVSSQKDGLNNTTQYSYDSAGRLGFTLDPLSHRTDLTYDDAGRPKTLKNRRSKVFTFGYGADGLSNSFTYPTGRQSEILARNALALPTSLGTPSGAAIALTYDEMGRTKTHSDAVGSIEWFYDNEGNATDVTETVGASATTIHRVFDKLGRIESCTDSLGYTVGYTYYGEGTVKTVVYPGGKTVTYTYDGANRLKTVVDWAGRTTSYTYDAGGRVDKVVRPNSTRHRSVFDIANRLTSSYEERMSGGSVVETLWQASYGYDDANRLTSFTPTPMARPFAPPAVVQTFDSDNQLATYNGVTVTHDLDGNLLSAPVNGTLLGGLVWDRRNRLVGAGGVSYAYDAEDRRTTSTIGGQTTTYVFSRGQSLDRLLQRVHPDGSITRYVYGDGLLYEETTTAGGGAQAPVYYHFDWRGDTVALSDSTGSVTARLNYSPFGDLTVENGAVSTPFRFNGKYGVITEATGLLCMQARFYSPSMKRFLSEDPIGFAGGRNLYAFVGADPINLMDPFGLGPNTIGAPGFWESFIPVWGSGRAAINDFQNGDWGGGLLNTAFAVTDLLAVKALATLGGKLLLREGLEMAAESEAMALSRGSTANLSKGTTLPRNLREQLAVEQATAAPQAGSRLPIKMTDPRWPASDGWVKMQQVINSGGREGPINVHYVRNAVTGAVDDFKIVVPGAK